MKNFLLFACMAIITSPIFAQPQNKNPKSPHDTISAGTVTVTYGRPYKKDREIFGDIVKYGEVWRTGANEATEITFTKDGSFAGLSVKAGTYTLFTIPGEKEWTVILNSALRQWGAFGYDKVKDQNALLTKVPSVSLESPVEQFTITATEKGLILEWDKTKVEIPYAF